MEISFISAIPVLRIFDITKAEEFYQGFLGFRVDWDHRFRPGAPLYRQISRGNLLLHLSEHHGDGTPGAYVRVMMNGVEALQRELNSKGYSYMKPGIEMMPWGMIETGVIDPFGNCIRFCQRVEQHGTLSAGTDERRPRYAQSVFDSEDRIGTTAARSADPGGPGSIAPKVDIADST